MIGCGDHALQSHAIPGQNVEGLDLVAVCDPNTALLERFVAALAHPAIPMTEAAILEHPDIDAVIIASPDRFHAASLSRAVQSSKHVMCEKPLATETEELTDLWLALEAADTDLVITSCHPRRFDIPYVWLQQ